MIRTLWQYFQPLTIVTDVQTKQVLWKLMRIWIIIFLCLILLLDVENLTLLAEPQTISSEDNIAYNHF
jgi:hypothetical protein